MENSVDLDQMILSEASWSGSTVFSKKDKYELIQQDNGCEQKNHILHVKGDII